LSDLDGEGHARHLQQRKNKVSLTICLAPTNTLWYPQAGGHLWVYLNWALGFRALGHEVIWLETIDDQNESLEQVKEAIAALKSRLEPYGFEDRVALCSRTGTALPRRVTDGCLDLDAATEADLLLNQYYSMDPSVVARFRRSALLDIDPGRLQTWMSRGQIRVAPHDVYFTIGETVGRPGARFPDVSLQWEYAAPCIALEWWPPRPSAETSPFTTVSHWGKKKRDGFLAFLDLPSRTDQRLELALPLSQVDDQEVRELRERGWNVSDANVVASTPWDYQRYIQTSLGEFSCAKPSYTTLQTAWISDRTLCYLASGKPAVVQHTGPSQFLRASAGLCRFRDVVEAARLLETVVVDYECQSRLARSLAEEYFDAKKVVKYLLERALS
jgi:hypothetical protein